MNETLISSQVNLILLSAVFGLIIGAYYDIFRLIRIIANKSDIKVLVFDLAFTLSIAPFIYLFFSAFNSGNVRYSLIFIQFLGVIFYRFTIGEITVRLFKTIIIPIKLFYKMITKPIKQIFAILCTKIDKIEVMINNKVNMKKISHKNKKKCKKHLKN